MRVIKARNVNGLYVEGLDALGTYGVGQHSRAGKVMVMPTPVMSVYEKPTERVLFCERRDANPFFHFFESLWMLAGRQDAEPLDHYISDFGERFAESNSGGKNTEDGGIIHDAYGHRWRRALGFDQLEVVIKKLQKNPDDRQCVIQMWDATPNETYENSETFGDNAELIHEGYMDLTGDWKTRPCNTHVYLRVRKDGSMRDTRDSDGFTEDGLVPRSVLDLTVLCRSNDVVWGAYGANAVQFSMLQEYLARHIGVDVGTMYQFSNNYHGYLDTLDKIGDPLELSGTDPYEDATVTAMPIGDNWAFWDKDLTQFMLWHDRVWEYDGIDKDYGVPPPSFKNRWFEKVAVPMTQARFHWKNKRRERALGVISDVAATDWRMAAEEWMKRRIDK